MKGVYENTDEASPFRRRPDFDLLHLKNGAQDTLPVNQSVYQISTVGVAKVNFFNVVQHTIRILLTGAATNIIYKILGSTEIQPPSRIGGGCV